MKAVIGRGLFLSFLFTRDCRGVLLFSSWVAIRGKLVCILRIEICRSSTWLVDFEHYSSACLGYCHMDRIS